ncbi:MAG TPA: hypothetical protein PLL33_04820 [Paracoccus sp. (in: a-proteobacteria)]|nr:hypothetical protein [Paracoccus sp. (in: a-proteobacteria)]
MARLPLGEIVNRVQMIGGTAGNSGDLEGERFLGAAPEAKIRIGQAREMFFA